MIPAKHRERKCSTCKHYQPSPLWRKGWCRNPLLYDRNTNHLVEADSLACNRTFIDYWEPASGPQHLPGPQPRGGKPRIAPSIPMEKVDIKGQRSVTTGNTPAEGMPVIGEGLNWAQPKNRQKAEGRKGSPQLALVTPDYTPEPDELNEDPTVTLQLERVEGPEPLAALRAGSEPLEGQPEKPTAQRIREARRAMRPSFFGLTGLPLWASLGGLVALLAVVALLAALNRPGGPFGLSEATQGVPGAAQATTTASAPDPTPTGFGDPTPTTPPQPTTPPSPPSAGVIAVGGWVQVVNTSAGLTVRPEPSTSGGRITALRQGTKARVVDGPHQADGYTWWKLDSFSTQDPSLSGWCADAFLQPTTAP